jgi:hypothetical protein
MKKILFICCCFTFIACSSPEKKAKNLINEELRTTLHDFKSYEPVTFGNLDSTFTYFSDTPKGDSIFRKLREKQKELESAIDYSNEASEKYKTISFENSLKEYYLQEKIRTFNESQVLRREVDKERDIFVKLSVEYVRKFNGWEMQHSFRSKTLGGNYKLVHRLYTFDKEITKIIKSSEE